MVYKDVELPFTAGPIKLIGKSDSEHSICRSEDINDTNEYDAGEFSF